MSGLSATEVKESLSVFDINVEDDAALGKMLEIAQLFDYDADSIVNEWLAYQSTHGCTLNLENLDKLLLEKTVGKNRAKNNRTPASNRKRKPLAVYTAENISQLVDNSILEGDSDEENDLLSAYGTPNRAQTKSKRSQNVTPRSGVKVRPGIPSQLTTSSIFSPASLSPSTTSSQKYGSRSGSGDVLASYGPSHTAITNHRGTGRKISVNVDKRHNICKTYKYMFQKLVDLSDAMDEMIENVAETIRQQNSNEIEAFTPCSMPSQEPVYIVGRICCDLGGGVGKLNPQSVLLQGDRIFSAGKSVSIDLSQLEEFSLFPGQIVAMYGSNPNGKKFIPTKIFTPKCDQTNIKKLTITPESEPLSLVIAAGPFTTSDCLSYEPLSDLLQKIKNTRPDITIIIGPIVDNKHEDIKSAKFSVTYEDFLQDKLNSLIAEIRELTHLILVPSVKEAGCHPVYPQPPCMAPPHAKNVTFVGDPCVVDVNGLTIGVTSNDVLFHLGAEEISKVKGPSDRLGRLAGHILKQKSFYPLYPSNESINVDWIAAEQYGSINKKLDLIILPSDLKCFVKKVDGCVCVNPGRLAKGVTGGTFAQILVEPSETDAENNVAEINAQIVKI